MVISAPATRNEGEHLAEPRDVTQEWPHGAGNRHLLAVISGPFCPADATWRADRKQRNVAQGGMASISPSKRSRRVCFFLSAYFRCGETRLHWRPSSRSRRWNTLRLRRHPSRYAPPGFIQRGSRELLHEIVKKINSASCFQHRDAWHAIERRAFGASKVRRQNHDLDPDLNPCSSRSPATVAFSVPMGRVPCPPIQAARARSETGCCR